MPGLVVPVLHGDGIRLRPLSSADLVPAVSAVRDPLVDWIPTVDAEVEQAAARE